MNTPSMEHYGAVRFEGIGLESRRPSGNSAVADDPGDFAIPDHYEDSISFPKCMQCGSENLADRGDCWHCNECGAEEYSVIFAVERGPHFEAGWLGLEHFDWEGEVAA